MIRTEAGIQRKINNIRAQGEKIIPIWGRIQKNRSAVNTINRRTPSVYKKILPVPIKVEQGVSKH